MIMKHLTDYLTTRSDTAGLVTEQLVRRADEMEKYAFYLKQCALEWDAKQDPTPEYLDINVAIENDISEILAEINKQSGYAQRIANLIRDIADESAAEDKLAS